MISNSSKDLQRSGRSAFLFCMWGDEAESEIVAGPKEPSKSVAELGLRAMSPDSQAGPRPLYHVPALHCLSSAWTAGPAPSPLSQEAVRHLSPAALSPKTRCLLGS